MTRRLIERPLQCCSSFMSWAAGSALLSIAACVAAMPGAYAQAPDAKAVAQNYARLVHANYTDVLASAKAMQKQIQAFNARPSEEQLKAARAAWTQARQIYGQTEAFRFYGGPIDDAKGPEGRINAWPMDESFVDGVQDRPDSGLINDTSFAITSAALKRMNERGGEENIATGWHAIEFLLWGQDLNENGPGQRSYEDFVDGKSKHAKRRRQYLRVVTDLLIEDLSFLVKAWQPGQGSYRTQFERANTEAVRRILVGIGSLSRAELAGERIEVALATQDQEDEHSCFSDTTHLDILNNAKGIVNVWLGRYQRADGSLVEGPGLKDLVAARDPALAERVSAEVAASVVAAQAIPAPFDRAIVGDNKAPGRVQVQAVADALKKQTQSFVQAAQALGITRLTLEESK